VPDRRFVIRGILAAGFGCLMLAGCGGGSSTGPVAADALLLADGSPNPAQLMKAGPLGEKVLGNPNAPATIIEYASLTCPYCHKFHLTTFPRIKKELIDTGKVRFIIREFPIGRTAAAAAIVTRCAREKDYLTLFDKFLTQQAKWTSQKVRPDAIYKIAAQTGMKRSTFDACLANKEIEEGLIWIKERGRDFGVSGTPTFFINGKKARGVLTFEQVKAMIEGRTS
jgi:protein-disulfide isomerase